MDDAKAAGCQRVELSVEPGSCSTRHDARECEKCRGIARERGLALQTVAGGMNQGSSVPVVTFVQAADALRIVEVEVRSIAEQAIVQL